MEKSVFDDDDEDGESKREFGFSSNKDLGDGIVGALKMKLHIRNASSQCNGSGYGVDKVGKRRRKEKRSLSEVMKGFWGRKKGGTI